MASLPNKSFVFNYNARDYNTSTHTIPRTSGQTLAQDMVWTGTTNVINNIVFDEDHITVPISGFSLFNFSSSGANPMNNTAAAPAMTIVAKFKYNTSSPGSNFFNNRDATTYNYFARCGLSSGGSGVLSLGTLGGANTGPNYDTSQPVIASWRVNSSRSIDIKNLTEGTSSTIGTTTWNGGTQWFTFFVWKKKTANTINTTNYGEWMGGDFYWCYATREVLTDEEIQQVVNYNENGGFGPDRDSDVVATSGGTVQVTLSADTTWSASTASDWITISPITGSGETNVTLTVAKNIFSNRTGAVTFTDGEDTALFTIYQGGTDGLVPYKKIFRNENRIN